MNLINTSKDLEEACKILKKQKTIAIDCEFIREKTYYPIPCLIQVGYDQGAFLIDPLAKDMDFSLFAKLMQNKKILKVFHSGRQDIEILYQLSGFIPTPLFDTQIAAMVCGFGEAVSYETLVNKICGISLDKSSRLSDWSCRPLSNSQLEYALSDATHLVNIYKFLKQHLKQTGREHWIDEENSTLSSPQTYQNNPYDMWQKLKHRSHNTRYLTILRELCAWRELRAQNKNTPRQSLIKDDCLLNIAAVCPETIEDFDKIRNIHKDIAKGKLGKEILEVIKYCQNITHDQYVKLHKETKTTSSSMALYELLKLLLKITSQNSGVVAKLIATDDDLKNFSSYQDKNNPILKGWRKELFGHQALALRDGLLRIGYNKNKHCIDIQIDK
jgi:ribonuclease D